MSTSAVAAFPLTGYDVLPAFRRLWIESSVISRETENSSDVLEAQAVARARGGDPDAYDYLVSKYMRRVMSISWGIVRNAHDAEDIAQETFVRAYRNIGRFRQGEPFGPWIYRIATNLALDMLKHRRRVPEDELTEDRPSDRRDSPELGAEVSQIASRIDEALQKLPPMQGIVARLHLVEGFDHREIASMMSLSEGTVRSHLSLGRKKLQEMLRDLSPEES